LRPPYGPDRLPGDFPKDIAVTLDEQAQKAVDCCNAGATSLHIHVREADGKGSKRLSMFNELSIQPYFMLASIAQLETAERLIRRGLYKGPLNHCLVAIGGGAVGPDPFNAMDYIRKSAQGGILQLEGIMRNVAPTMAIALGLHVRVGIEDNVWKRPPRRFTSVQQVEQDAPFYRESGGGLTLSGDECRRQPTFCAAALAEARHRGMRTAIETAGNVPRDAFAQVLAHADVVLHDFKVADPERHRARTGADNRLLHANHRRAYAAFPDARFIARTPLVAGINDDEGQVRRPRLHPAAPSARHRLLVAPRRHAQQQRHPGQGERRAQQVEVEPAHLLHEPAGRRVDERARDRGEAREQRELGRRIAGVGRPRDERGERGGA
jgi:pyruvate-formate lyase-activating enzyme